MKSNGVARLRWAVKIPDLDKSCFEDTLYEGECECGQVIKIRTQRDERPEYYTEIYVTCPKCGADMHYSLPVN